MRCVKCGKEAAPGSAYCEKCGKRSNPARKPAVSPRKDDSLYDEDGVLTFDPEKETYHEREDEEESNEQYFSEQDRDYHRKLEEKRRKRLIVVDPNNPGRDIYVPDSLIAAIIFTVICCQPLGLIAIYYAVQTNRAIARGDKQTALRFSKWARLWIIISVIVSVALMFLTSEIGKNARENEPQAQTEQTVESNNDNQ